VAEHAEQSFESAVELFPMRAKESSNIVFCALLWISAPNCLFRHAMNERKKSAENNSLWVGVMFGRYEVT
jgi:hypothetical protein